MEAEYLHCLTVQVCVSKLPDCDICGETFASQHHMRLHKIVVHGMVICRGFTGCGVAFCLKVFRTIKVCDKHEAGVKVGNGVVKFLCRGLARYGKEGCAHVFDKFKHRRNHELLGLSAPSQPELFSGASDSLRAVLNIN